MKISRYITDPVIVISAICVAMSFLCQIFEITFIVNYIYAFTLLIIFGSYFVGNHISKNMLFLIFMMCISAVIRGFPKRNFLDYFGHLLIMVCAYICIETASVVNLKRKSVNIIALLFLATAIILLAGYYVGPLKWTYVKRTGALLLNFSNPNTTGLWLACIFILIAYASFLFKRFLKVVFLVAAVGMLPIILATKSRNSYFACILFVAAVVISKVFGIRKVPQWFLKLIACLPVIVFFFYMFVIVKNIEFWEPIFTIEDINKSIGARVSVWQNVLDDFWSCFLFGNYPKFYDSQMHNSLMTIYCRFGAPSTIAVCVLIYRALAKLQANNSFYGVISLSAILFTGCFEASLFIGVAGLYLMLLILPACASVEAVKSADIDQNDANTQYIQYRGI